MTPREEKSTIIFSVKFGHKNENAAGDLCMYHPVIIAQKYVAAPIIEMSGLLIGSYMDSLNADLSLAGDKKIMTAHAFPLH